MATNFCAMMKPMGEMGEMSGDMSGDKDDDWAMDGFGIYAYQDVNGAAPIVDECGGHFGPVDSGEVVYHYHSRPIVPYHLACQGPSLGQCASTQRGTNFCHPGCGAEICVQPGTSEEELRAYLGVWDDSWLDNYTSNEYKQY